MYLKIYMEEVRTELGNVIGECYWGVLCLCEN